jgi:DNA repair exonuclease SbcCD ATPase subunit
MTPDYVRKDEFNAALQAILVAIGGLAQRFDKMDQRLSTLESGQVRIEEGQTRLEAGQLRLEGKQSELENGQSQIIEYLKEFRGAIEAGQRDTNIQMAEGHAKLQEQINELTRRDKHQEE